MGPRIRRRALLRLALAGLAAGMPALARAQTAAPATTAAPEPVTREVQQALTAATERFQALDSPGVLAHVSEQYRNGPFTKPALREHLLAMFTLYDTVRARIRVDEVRLVDGAAWVFSTGEITGRLRGIGLWTSALTWEREPDVARKEGGAWRLVGPGP
ncbi:MAG: hypothetical protein ACHQ7H_10480 [Candidatus Rokuibacteriota bacterium]|jgi:hypothetical protein